MLVNDTVTQERHRRVGKIEKTRAVAHHGAADDIRSAGLVADKRTSVASLGVQEGTKLSATRFMELLHKINKDLVLIPHPAVFAADKNTAFYRMNCDKATLNLVVGDRKIQVVVCEGDWMPEWDVMDTAKVKVPDSTNPALPWHEVERPWHLTKRGWRTVLFRLIQQKIVTVDDVERVFGVGNRPVWKIMTGKGQGILPY